MTREEIVLREEPDLDYTSKDNRSFFGTGYIVFMKITEGSSMTIVEGNIEFSISNENIPAKRSIFTGTFRLPVNGLIKYE